MTQMRSSPSSSRAHPGQATPGIVPLTSHVGEHVDEVEDSVVQVGSHVSCQGRVADGGRVARSDHRGHRASELGSECCPSAEVGMLRDVATEDFFRLAAVVGIRRVGEAFEPQPNVQMTWPS